MNNKWYYDLVRDVIVGLILVNFVPMLMFLLTIKRGLPSWYWLAFLVFSIVFSFGNAFRYMYVAAHDDISESYDSKLRFVVLFAIYHSFYWVMYGLYNLVG